MALPSDSLHRAARAPGLWCGIRALKEHVRFAFDNGVDDDVYDDGNNDDCVDDNDGIVTDIDARDHDDDLADDINNVNNVPGASFSTA